MMKSSSKPQQQHTHTTASTADTSSSTPLTATPSFTSPLSTTTATATPQSTLATGTSSGAAIGGFAVSGDSPSRDLLLELKRSGKANIPTYNDALVRRSLHEMQLVSQQLEQLVTAATTSASSASSSTPRKPDMSVRPALFLLDAKIQRQKQCLLAYHVVRWNRLRHTLYYHDHATTATATTALTQQQFTKGLSEAEQDVWKEYDALVTNYTHQWGFRPTTMHGSTLSFNMDSASTMCQVRVIASEPILVILSTTGQVMEFTPNAMYYLPRDDVQDLFHQGVMEPVAGEEDLE